MPGIVDVDRLYSEAAGVGMDVNDTGEWEVGRAGRVDHACRLGTG